MPAASKEWLQNTFTESEHAASVTRPSRPLAHVTLESSDAEQEREEKTRLINGEEWRFNCSLWYSCCSYYPSIRTAYIDNSFSEKKNNNLSAAAYLQLPSNISNFHWNALYAVLPQRILPSEPTLFL